MYPYDPCNDSAVSSRGAEDVLDKVSYESQEIRMAFLWAGGTPFGTFLLRFSRASGALPPYFMTEFTLSKPTKTPPDDRLLLVVSIADRALSRAGHPNARLPPPPGTFLGLAEPAWGPKESVVCPPGHLGRLPLGHSRLCHW